MMIASDAIAADPSDQNADGGTGGGSDGASSSLTDDHHRWATQFCGIDTAQTEQLASSDDGQAAASAKDAAQLATGTLNGGDPAAAGSGGASPLLGDTAGDGGDSEQRPEQLQSGGGGGDEQPTFNPTSSVPTDINANTAQDFVTRANATSGNGAEVGHMQSGFKFNLEFGADNKITRVNMVVDTSIVRPRWAGGRPNDVQRAAIKKAEDFIKAHEERHRDIARDFARQAVKAMRGKTDTGARKEFDKVMKNLDKAQQQLDIREGCIFVTERDGGKSVDVSVGPCS
jgi:hypothetical protein